MGFFVNNCLLFGFFWLTAVYYLQKDLLTGQDHQQQLKAKMILKLGKITERNITPCQKPVR